MIAIMKCAVLGGVGVGRGIRWVEGLSSVKH